MKILTASAKHYYSNADNSIMGKIIILPDTVDETQFSEITESAYKKAEQARQAKIEAELQALHGQAVTDESGEQEQEEQA